MLSEEPDVVGREFHAVAEGGNHHGRRRPGSIGIPVEVRVVAVLDHLLDVVGRTGSGVPGEMLRGAGGPNRLWGVVCHVYNLLASMLNNLPLCETIKRMIYDELDFVLKI